MARLYLRPACLASSSGMAPSCPKASNHPSPPILSPACSLDVLFTPTPLAPTSAATSMSSLSPRLAPDCVEVRLLRALHRRRGSLARPGRSG